MPHAPARWGARPGDEGYHRLRHLIHNELRCSLLLSASNLTYEHYCLSLGVLLKEFQRIHEGVYNSAQMDSGWTPEIEADFHSWRQDNTPEQYQHLEWDEDKKDQDQQTSEEADTLL